MSGTKFVTQIAAGSYHSVMLSQYQVVYGAGGNGDGVIDNHDGIWPQLRAWVDENHDGISQPNELYKLEDVGVYSISLKYVHQRRYDQYGNLFRYKGTLNPGGEPRGDSADRTVYDVILVSAPL